MGHSLNRNRATDEEYTFKAPDVAAHVHRALSVIPDPQRSCILVQFYVRDFNMVARGEADLNVQFAKIEWKTRVSSSQTSGSCGVESLTLFSRRYTGLPT